jgi:NADH dehydrogenase
MILLTGATGTVGAALLQRMTAAGLPVRCLVRDPRRLGSERVRVQIALGDLAEPSSFRNALRGVSTVVHLAAAIRDQERASIEELNGVATLRLLQAAAREGAESFVFFSALGATLQSEPRFFRAKATAERAVTASPLRTTIVAPSLIYAPGDPWLRLLGRMSLLPAVPIPGSGRALYQPIWADDVADCVMSLLQAREPPGDGEAEKNPGSAKRVVLAGPETLSHAAIVAAFLRSIGRPRPLAPVPIPLVRVGLRAVEWLWRESAFATWDEAELLQVPMTTARGTTDARALGVEPRALAAVLGAG